MISCNTSVMDDGQTADGSHAIDADSIAVAHQ